MTSILASLTRIALPALVVLAAALPVPASAAPTAAGPSASTAVSAPAIMPARRSCGNGVYASGTASCPFARNVAAAYRASGGSRYLYDVYSPATGLSYDLRCSSSNPATCRVGRAVITIYTTWAKYCSSGVYAGGTASCPFARNVASAYYDSGGSGWLYDVYSPATGKYYDLRCRGSAPVTCAVGRARIYLY